MSDVLFIAFLMFCAAVLLGAHWKATGFKRK